MYNSIFGYAYKLIKGSIIFSIILLIALSQIMSLVSIYTLVWRYEIILSGAASFFKAFSVYSFFVVSFITVIVFSLMSSFYIFSKNNRMFSTLRIFGATKNSLIKLSIIQSAMYSLASLVVALIEMIVLYIRYRGYILTITPDPQIFSSALMFLFSNIALSICFILVFVISTFMLLNKDPYEDLRGTL